jgi:hypothetical protein
MWVRTIPGPWLKSKVAAPRNQVSWLGILYLDQYQSWAPERAPPNTGKRGPGQSSPLLGYPGLPKAQPTPGAR